MRSTERLPRWRPRPARAMLDAMPGLYDDEFVGYRITTDDELNVALREGVVLSTAPERLLGLYRYLPQTANDLIKILGRLEDRLIVPNQALREFCGTVSGPREAPEPPPGTPRAPLARRRPASSKRLRPGPSRSAWIRRALGFRRRDGFAGKIREEGCHAQQGRCSIWRRRPDPRAAQGLLDGRVTAALPDEQWKECVAEGHRRVEAEEPPGYKDAGKQEGDTPEGAAGDYLVWYQATRHAAERGCDLIVVTVDERRLVVATTGGATGYLPRADLRIPQADWASAVPNASAGFPAHAAVLDVEVDQQSLADADRPERGGRRPAAVDSGRGPIALLARLDEEAPVQAEVIRLAAQSGGRVTREQVYKLGGFPDDRMLRGFTCPPARITVALQDEGVVPDRALLDPRLV